MTTPVSVVLADDDAHITYVVAMRLSTAGFQVTVARDGEEALELALQVRPALVITDLQMPRMSGLELAIKLKTLPETCNTPVIMLTARGYLADQALMSQTNIQRVLPKPFSAKEILKLATEILSASSGGAAAA